MKRLLVCTGLFIVATALFAQQTPPASPPAVPPASPPETVAPQTAPAVPPAAVAPATAPAVPPAAVAPATAPAAPPAAVAPATAPAAPPAAAAPPTPPKSPSATESGTIGGKAITITYSSPGVKGRTGKIFTKDGLIGKDPHYPVWRASANAATKLHTDADLDITGLKIPKGDYTLFVDLTDPDNWVLIVNKQTGQWGLAYDKAQDLGQVKMTMEKPPALVENLKYTVKDLGGNKGKLTLAWENHSGSVPIVVH